VTDRPCLAALLDAPARAAEVPTAEVPALLDAIGREEGRLGVLKSILAARLAVGEGNGHGDRLLDVEAMAEKIGAMPGWLRHHAACLPFAKKPSEGQLRFSEREADAWIAAGCPHRCLAGRT
jgi:hypothetical protein